MVKFDEFDLILFLVGAMALQLVNVQADNWQPPKWTAICTIILPLLMVLMEQLLESKKLFYKNCSERPKTRIRPLGIPCQQFWRPRVAILNFAGLSAL